MYGIQKQRGSAGVVAVSLWHGGRVGGVGELLALPSKTAAANTCKKLARSLQVFRTCTPLRKRKRGHPHTAPNYLTQDTEEDTVIVTTYQRAVPACFCAIITKAALVWCKIVPLSHRVFRGGTVGVWVIDNGTWCFNAKILCKPTLWCY